MGTYGRRPSRTRRILRTVWLIGASLAILAIIVADLYFVGRTGA